MAPIVSTMWFETLVGLLIEINHLLPGLWWISKFTQASQMIKAHEGLLLNIPIHLVSSPTSIYLKDQLNV